MNKENDLKRILISAAALGVVAAACGGTSGAEGVASLNETDDATPAAAAEPEVDAEEAFLAFTNCMREQGVDLPDPQTDGEGNFFFEDRRPGNGELDRGELRAAGEACQHHLEGVTQTFRDFDRTEIEDSLVEFASCMRENGYDMPDPDLSNFGPQEVDPDEVEDVPPGGGPFGELDQDDPAFQTAIAACEELLGGLRRGPGGGGPGGGGPGGDA